MMWLARGARPPGEMDSTPAASDIKELVHEAPLTDDATLVTTIQWLLSPGTDRKHPALYKYTVGRVIAVMAYERVRTYAYRRGAPVPEEDAIQLVHIMKNMARNCAWKRTKDTHCFQQIKALLQVPRLATLVYIETPMEQITLQLDPEITNKIVASRVDFDAGKKITNAKWHRESSTEMFIAAIGVLREYLDVDLRLYINSEIPFSHADTLPAFVLLCEEYAERHGTLFGFIKDNVVTFLDPSTPYLIPQTICRWLRVALDTCRLTTLDMLDAAVSDPKSIMESNKFLKFSEASYAGGEKKSEDEGTVPDWIGGK